jgi:hypothetical protein
MFGRGFDSRRLHCERIKGVTDVVLSMFVTLFCYSGLEIDVDSVVEDTMNQSDKLIEFQNITKISGKFDYALYGKKKRP